MKIVPNDSAKMLVKENYELIYKFIMEHLDGLDKQSLMESLDIRIEQYDGDQELPPGQVTIREDYWNPLITLYEDPLRIEYEEPLWPDWSFYELRLLVLFHELSHMVIWLSDIKGNMWFFKSNDNISSFESAVETLCNVMAERYLRRNGFLRHVKHVYFSPYAPGELFEKIHIKKGSWGGYEK